MKAPGATLTAGAGPMVSVPRAGRLVIRTPANRSPAGLAGVTSAASVNGKSPTTNV